jgi:hypothetical protein
VVETSTQFGVAASAKEAIPVCLEAVKALGPTWRVLAQDENSMDIRWNDGTHHPIRIQLLVSGSGTRQASVRAMTLSEGWKRTYGKTHARLVSELKESIEKVSRRH